MKVRGDCPNHRGPEQAFLTQRRTAFCLTRPQDESSPEGRDHSGQAKFMAEWLLCLLPQFPTLALTSPVALSRCTVPGTISSALTVTFLVKRGKVKLLPEEYLLSSPWCCWHRAYLPSAALGRYKARWGPPVVVRLVTVSDVERKCVS